MVIKLEDDRVSAAPDGKLRRIDLHHSKWGMGVAIKQLIIRIRLTLYGKLERVVLGIEGVPHAHRERLELVTIINLMAGNADVIFAPIER